MGRRSIIEDYLFSVRLQIRGLVCAAGVPARGAPLAWGRCCAEIYDLNINYNNTNLNLRINYLNITRISFRH